MLAMTDLPDTVSLPEPIASLDAPEAGATDSERARQLPDPVGWKLLCVVPEAADTYENSTIIKSTLAMKSEEIGTVVLFVLKVGPDAYKDTSKFGAPWCKAGDFVLVRTYTGTRFKIYGKEFRLLNDDQIEAVVDDPRGISRVAV